MKLEFKTDLNPQKVMTNQLMRLQYFYMVVLKVDLLKGAYPTLY